MTWQTESNKSIYLAFQIYWYSMILKSRAIANLLQGGSTAWYERGCQAAEIKSTHAVLCLTFALWLWPNEISDKRRQNEQSQKLTSDNEPPFIAYFVRAQKQRYGAK